MTGFRCLIVMGVRDIRTASSVTSSRARSSSTLVRLPCGPCAYVLRRQLESVDTQYQIGVGTEVHRRCCLVVALADGRDPRDVEMENTMRSPAKSTIERLREQIEKMETT
jgi:hypothetical protein